MHRCQCPGLFYQHHHTAPSEMPVHPDLNVVQICTTSVQICTAWCRSVRQPVLLYRSVHRKCLLSILHVESNPPEDRICRTSKAVQSGRAQVSSSLFREPCIRAQSFYGICAESCTCTMAQDAAEDKAKLVWRNSDICLVHNKAV